MCKMGNTPLIFIFKLTVVLFAGKNRYYTEAIKKMFRPKKNVQKLCYKINYWEIF
jgi:hypothetical protein